MNDNGKKPQLGARLSFYLPIVVELLLKHNIDNPIKAPKICEYINATHPYPNSNWGKFKEVDLRAICEYCHSLGIADTIPVAAHKHGYYYCRDAKDYEPHLSSIRSRIISLSIGYRNMRMAQKMAERPEEYKVEQEELF